MAATRHRSFAPVVDRETRILLLGSLPGTASLAAGRYYAHPRNQFWRLVGAATGMELEAQPYSARLAALLARGIGLWDVIADAVRRGSLDAKISEAVPNDLATLVGSLPSLTTIAFNGGTAARIGSPMVAGRSDLRLLRLPSSSPAHAIPLERKLEAWRAIAI